MGPFFEARSTSFLQSTFGVRSIILLSSIPAAMRALKKASRSMLRDSANIVPACASDMGAGVKVEVEETLLVSSSLFVLGSGGGGSSSSPEVLVSGTLKLREDRGGGTGRALTISFNRAGFLVANWSIMAWACWREVRREVIMFSWSMVGGLWGGLRGEEAVNDRREVGWVLWWGGSFFVGLFCVSGRKMI